MSDSDLDDKLPLFENTDSDDDDDSDPVSKTIGKNSVKVNKAEVKRQEIDAKTNDYMTNALKAMKSQTGMAGSSSNLEDKFLKLNEMDQFLDAEDAKAMKAPKKKVDEVEEDDIDMFASDAEEEDEEATNAMYKDFFDPVEPTQDHQGSEAEGDDEADDEEMEQDEEPPMVTKRQNLLKSDDDDDDDDQDQDLGEVKSSHELRTIRLAKKIKKMEAEAVETKSWQLTGEVAAIERPENALLGEYLDYDTVAKAAPIITEEVSKRLEDIIVQRIKDQAWDDVERKIKPIENPYEYKKKLILDQEKSKLSLAQVYEDEYLKQKGDAEAAKKAPG
jgi:U3 small nucleolar RNA-associated protein MPP10